MVTVAFIGVLRLHTDNSLKRYNNADSEVRRDDALLNDKLAGTGSLFFLVEGTNQDSMKDPRVLQGMEKLQTFLESQPLLEDKHLERDMNELVVTLVIGVDATAAAPFLLLQPGRGAGTAGSRTPRPAATRLQSLITHAVFGLGLYVSGWAAHFIYSS